MIYLVKGLQRPQGHLKSASIPPSEAHSELEQKKERIGDRKSELASLSEQIKGDDGLELLGVDILERIDRAVKWMLPQIATYKTENFKKSNDWESKIIGALEHRRWNAYMRSEGYIFSGSTDESSRNDLAKMHHDLVDFSSLTEEEKRKDRKVATK